MKSYIWPTVALALLAWTTGCENGGQTDSPPKQLEQKDSPTPRKPAPGKPAPTTPGESNVPGGQSLPGGQPGSQPPGGDYRKEAPDTSGAEFDAPPPLEVDPGRRPEPSPLGGGGLSVGEDIDPGSTPPLGSKDSFPSDNYQGSNSGASDALFDDDGDTSDDSQGDATLQFQSGKSDAGKKEDLGDGANSSD